MSTSRPDRQHFEDAVRAAVSQHFDAAKARVPAFLEQHYRSLAPVLKRNFRGLLDTPIQLRNVAAWVSKKCRGPDFSTTTYTEDSLRKLFLDELVQVEALQQIMAITNARLVSQFDRDLDQLRQHNARLGQRSVEEINKFILERVSQANDLGDEVKKLVTAASFAIATYVVTGEVARTLSPIGVAVAEGAFLANAGFWAGIWYGVFGVPAWVGIVGGVAGAGAGLLIAPLIGGIVEYGLNRRRSLDVRFRARLDEVHQFVLCGATTPTKDVEGVIAQALRYFDHLVEALEFLEMIFGEA